MFGASDISFSYGKNQVLRQISLEARPGDCVGIIGANGCGKSTLLSILSGAVKCRTGKIYMDGMVLTKRRMFRTYIGYVPQECPLFPELTVMDNLKLWMENGKNLRSFLTEGNLRILELEPVLKKPVGQLSGGMKKRVSIGCAMLTNPPVMILDEPGAALDLVCKEAIITYLQAYRDSGGIILLATHEDQELSLCNRLYVMKDGGLRSADCHIRGKELVRLF